MGQPGNAPRHVPLVASGRRPPEKQELLVVSRLGVYAGLFYALRAKHPPTAAHSLRVAIGCSKWASWCNLPVEARDTLEVAALLHDVGKIGVPDRVLQKPEQLAGQELLAMEMQQGVGEELLRGAGASDELIAMIRNSRHRQQLTDVHNAQAVAASMLAIVDAFDSMTTEQVFRRALSREHAFKELYAHAGNPFAKTLVTNFSELVSKPQPEIEAAIAKRWLSELSPHQTPGFGSADVPVSSGATQTMLNTLFHNRMLDTLQDVAVYLDSDGQILHWNRAAEQITGRQAASAMHCRWTMELMGLQSSEGQPLEECPLEAVWSTLAPIEMRLSVLHLDGSRRPVHLNAMPVFFGKQELAGAILTLRDTSAEASLEQTVQSLHQIATHDPLTKVANRAELDRRLPNFLDESAQEGRRGSLIICDIDFFKRINDKFGHQAGDEALVTFAALLKEAAREGDLVVRFGGEEFVILAEGCGYSAAIARAEEMRQMVEKKPIACLNGKSMTSSFGVTEVQVEDTPETLLARADRALLMAKEGGRNRVVHLGNDAHDESDAEKNLDSKPRKSSGWMGWFRNAGEQLIQAEYLAAVPKEVAVQKLKGFINDHHAELISIEESRVAIRVDSQKIKATRRQGERPTMMLMDVSICNVEVCSHGRQKTYQRRTKFSVTIRPMRARDRRSESLKGQAGHLLNSFQAYLVAQEIDDELEQMIIEPRV